MSLLLDAVLYIPSTSEPAPISVLTADREIEVSSAGVKDISSCSIQTGKMQRRKRTTRECNASYTTTSLQVAAGDAHSHPSQKQTANTWQLCATPRLLQAAYLGSDSKNWAL
jgi:hypothetical protein